MSRSLVYTYAAALVSASAWGFALGYGIWSLGWIAFLPLWGVWIYRPVPLHAVLKHTTGPSLLVYAGAFLLAYPWVGAHATDAGIQAGISALVILALLYSLPLMAGAQVALRGRRGTGVAVWVGGWMLVDLLLQYGSWAFPWALGAHAIVDSPGTYTLIRFGGPVAGTAAIGGLHAGLLAVLQMTTLESVGKQSVRAGVAGLVVVLLGLLVVSYGTSSSSSTSAPVPPAHAWAVQPDVAPTTWANADDPMRKARLLALTQTALDTTSAPPSLIVWPETALHPADTTGMQAAVDRWGVAVLTGAVLPAGDPQQTSQTNSALLYRPHRTMQRYDKHHLVPFAEAVPGARGWQALRRFALAASNERAYVPGPGPVTFSHSDFSFVPLICFESLAAPLLARLDTDLPPTHALITLGQTGWWRRALPAQQHVQYSRLRAMETGRPLLVASVSGPTTLVAPSGAATVLAPFGEATVASVRWPAPHPPGWYMRTAPYTDIAWTAIALLLVSVPLRWLS
ncbi:apolipoprotein N-acyltransferase [Longimonas halophila]|uniref:Apolipoprotein N-acyltransferase n=1 Tax=Longimonas halophila TaxID=1469170 RepID=A0A2H3P100_9BACT|nr:apolipoprotein N-acyltransferase [Longimonas halophila]PEN07072.1 apolipoprotein N-acyltransferase [Longimonas halophila]